MLRKELIYLIIFNVLILSGESFAQFEPKVQNFDRSSNASLNVRVQELAIDLKAPAPADPTQKQFSKFEINRLANSVASEKAMRQITARSSGGVIGTGGGNIGSSQMMNFIKYQLGGKPEKSRNFLIKKTLIDAIKTVVSVPPQDPIGNALAQDIRKMVQDGLLENIEATVYRPSAKCELKGIEKSATTEKINLFQNPKVALPEICLNIPKLISESASKAELVGLLLHEHSRHYGHEDTDELGIHRFAYGMGAWYDFLRRGYNPLNVELWGASTFADPDVIRFSEAAKAVTIFGGNADLIILLDKNLIGGSSGAVVAVLSPSTAGTQRFSVTEPIKISLSSYPERDLLFLQFSQQSPQLDQAKANARLILPSGKVIPIDLTKWGSFDNVRLNYPSLE